MGELRIRLIFHSGHIMVMPKVTSGSLLAQRGLLGPAWRFEIAQALIPHNLTAGDPWLADCQSYLAIRARADGTDLDSTPDSSLISAVITINDDIKLAETLKLMVTAGMSDWCVEQRLGVEPGLLQAWKALFFDVEDLRHASSWWALHVLEKERQNGNAEFAAKIALALCAGPDAVRVLLDTESGIPLDVADQLFEKKLTLQKMLNQAIAMPLDSETQRLRLMKYVANMEVAVRKTELEGEKLAARCRHAADRHERAMLRLELKLTRANQAAVDKLRNAQEREDRLADKGGSAAESRDRQKLRDVIEQTSRVERIVTSPLSRLRWKSSVTAAAANSKSGKDSCAPAFNEHVDGVSGVITGALKSNTNSSESVTPQLAMSA